MNAKPLIEQLGEQIRGHLATENINTPAMVGIQSGGAWIAEQLHRQLNLTVPLGTLNINFYRDDFSRRGLHPRVIPTVLPFEVEEQTILLIDDVLHTGRTIRAAMNEIFDYGRPARILLAVLAERNGRELPIEANFCGKHFQLKPEEHIKLSGPEPMKLEVLRT